MFKEALNQNKKFCHQLVKIVSFQTCLTDFLLWNAEDFHALQSSYKDIINRDRNYTKM